MSKYAMVKTDVKVYGRAKQTPLELVFGEVVKVESREGNTAYIKTYNNRELYVMNTRYLDFDIPQSEEKFFVSFGVRKLKGSEENTKQSNNPTRYAMIKRSVRLSDKLGHGTKVSVDSREIVELQEISGNAAYIKIYNDEKVYMVQVDYISLHIPQKDAEFEIINGRRKLKEYDQVKDKTLYAMLITNIVVHDNNKEPLELVQGEVVKVITVQGNIAMIRPYNKRKIYAIITKYLNFQIPQSDKYFYVSFGVRKLKELG